VIGEYAQADAVQVDAAVRAAREAFPGWSTSSIQARSDALDKIGSEILARKDELGTLLPREEGKVKSEATGGVVGAGYIFKCFAGECLRLGGQVLPSERPGVTVEVTREPIDVDYHVPFGGRKGSSYGPREQGCYAQEFFTVVKTSCLQAWPG
jgi:acyl-CoA reductase-like NAD-dependent aldehyde dehydrogenase